MNNEYMQYDSCVSRGICSINPRTAALQSVLLKFLEFISKYLLTLYSQGYSDRNSQEIVMNTIAIAVSNPDFTETSFYQVVDILKMKIPNIIKKYNEVFNEENYVNEDLNSIELFKQTENIISAIKYGELILKTTLEISSTVVRDLYKIMLVISKSISINLMDLESFDNYYRDGFVMILELLEMISRKESDIAILKTKIRDAVNIDNNIMRELRLSQEERYGKQEISEVSYSTRQSKAVLVAGSNIRELEIVLESLKDDTIDVYTHDDMMLAHTFPKFKSYSNLMGQYGQGLENCLLDFATFPGPIIFTKNSLHNIENFYRGLLFTTDYTCPKGVMKIENNDYSEVKSAAMAAKGFKTGKSCETVTVGYKYDEIISIIKSKLESGTYDKIFFIGLERYSLEQETYFRKLIQLAPQNILIISFSYNYAQENLIHINTCFDSYSMIKIYDELKAYDLEITFFIPKCDRNTISQMIYLKNCAKTNVYVGKCAPIILNPSLMKTLKDVFCISWLTSAKKDLEIIAKVK